jgi:hypothetical protein
MLARAFAYLKDLRAFRRSSGSPEPELAIMWIAIATCKRVANFYSLIQLVFTAKRKGILTKRMLENQRDRGKKKQGTRSCCLTALLIPKHAICYLK